MSQAIEKVVCATCRRELNLENDSLSLDCGGDCWGCVGETEANLGYRPSIERCNEEIDAGYRSGPKFKLEKDMVDGQE
jgi:hypothetical protein